MGANSINSRSRSRTTTTIPSIPIPNVPLIPTSYNYTNLLLTSSEFIILILSTFIKVLLFPSYHSTDFEVHRNWLAITHSLPLSEWYFDAGSEWTLDYPPFFAFFERFLSSFAYVIDPEIVNLNQLNYALSSCVRFQRGSVIITELVLGYAVLRWARHSMKPDYPTAYIIASSILLHPGLLIVDHIHFQYNGFLLGILVLSIVAAREGNMYLCAILFATLLNFKHLFIYLAPPYFIFLLRKHCFSSSGAFHLDRLIELGLIVLSIFAISFGPFVYSGGFSQLTQIFSRLFPFQRGLNHTYWAGNIWAVYSTVDRVLVKYLMSRGVTIDPTALLSSSRGLIGTTTFGVLPQITPTLTFSLTLGFILIYLTKLWFDPTYKRFLDSIILSAMTSFLWGWHVHEKAALLFLIPLSLAAVEDDDHFRVYVIASCAGIFGLFPLLIESAETPIKIIFSLIWGVITFSSLRKVVYRPDPNLISFLLNFAEEMYVAGFFFLQLYVSVIHEIFFPSPSTPISFIPSSSLISKVLNTTTTSFLTYCTPHLPINSTAYLLEVGQTCSEGIENILEVVIEKLSSSSSSIPEIEKIVEVVGGGGGKEGTMEFLPLMLISLYCAFGIIWAWSRLSWNYLRN